MAQGPATISVACPHCNAKQLESAYAKSTFCRKCGRHIDLRKFTAGSDQPGTPGSQEASTFEKFTRLFKREEFREIRCYHCNAQQTASSFAKSGSCTQCGGYIDLQDYKIAGNYSRSIQTQGTITIARGGEITSTKIVCHTAHVYGKVHGNVLCTGTMHMKTQGRLIGSIEAKEIVVEKKSEIEFVRPLRVTAIEIGGKVSARIYADKVTITKTGQLDGSINAKSISIEKGGIFIGDLFIGQPKFEQPELIPLRTETPAPGTLDLGDSSVALRPAT